MSVARHVKLFRNGRSQAVRIPREFELPGTDATIRKDGVRLVIELTIEQPIDGLRRLLQRWREEDEKFGPVEELGPIDDLPLRPIDL